MPFLLLRLVHLLHFFLIVAFGVFLFFFITLKPRVVWYTKSVSLSYEPASEPLHISVKRSAGWLGDRLVGWLFGWSVLSLVGWSVGRFFGAWFVGSFVGWLVERTVG